MTLMKIPRCAGQTHWVKVNKANRCAWKSSTWVTPPTGQASNPSCDFDQRFCNCTLESNAIPRHACLTWRHNHENMVPLHSYPPWWTSGSLNTSSWNQVWWGRVSSTRTGYRTTSKVSKDLTLRLLKWLKASNASRTFVALYWCLHVCQCDRIQKQRAA